MSLLRYPRVKERPCRDTCSSEDHRRGACMLSPGKTATDESSTRRRRSMERRRKRASLWRRSSPRSPKTELSCQSSKSVSAKGTLERWLQSRKRRLSPATVDRYRVAITHVLARIEEARTQSVMSLVGGDHPRSRHRATIPGGTFRSFVAINWGSESGDVCAVAAEVGQGRDWEEFSWRSPTTSGVDVDQESFVSALNDDRRTEFQSIVQYVSHIATITGAEFLSTIDELKAHLAQELQHAQILAEQVSFLVGGVPTTSVPPVAHIEDGRSALAADLKLEAGQAPGLP